MSQVAKRVRLGRYEQLDVIGEGAYGVVYKALDQATGEHLALKKLRHVDATSLARFKLDLQWADAHDEFARATLEGLGYGFYRHLMVNEPERAQQRIEEALSPWPAEPFSFAHFGRLIACSLIEQYRGGESALHWLENERERLERAFIFRGSVAGSSLEKIRGSAP